MSILVVVEHDNQAVNAATLNTLAAARQIGGDIHLLVAGEVRRRCKRSRSARGDNKNIVRR